MGLLTTLRACPRRTRRLTRGSLEGTSSLVLPQTALRTCTLRLTLLSVLTPPPRLRLRRPSPRRDGPLPRLVLRPGRLRLLLPRRHSLHRLRTRRINSVLVRNIAFS